MSPPTAKSGVPLSLVAPTSAAPSSAPKLPVLPRAQAVLLAWAAAGTRGFRTELSAVLAVALLVAVAGCGGEEPAVKPKPLRGAEPAGAAAPAADEGGNFINLGENPKWKPIRDLFRTYQKREIDGVANVTLNNTASFIEKPIIQQTAPEEVPGGTDEAALDLPDTCATKGDLESYKLIILLTGIPEPKAVFLGLDQNRCEVVRGDAIGNKGARVTAITQYKVIINVPGEEKDVEKSLVPPLKGFGESGDEESDVP